MTEKMRLEVINLLNKNIEDINRFNLHSAIWFCVDIFGHLDYDSAFFKSYMSCEEWIKDQFNKRCKHSEYVVAYLNGVLIDQKY